MFHDMRGLLTSISEGMKLLERRFKGKVGQEVEEIFQKTFQKALALNSLTEEFLQKFHHGHDSMSPQELLDLRKDIIDPVVREFEEEIQNRRITLVNCLSSADASQQRIQGDRVTLKSVFRNLLHNAITHGGVGCSIYLNVDESPGHFRLHVKNSGAPIPPGHQSEMFSAGQKKRNRSQGTGLALHLGRALMRSQGGDISYEPWQRGSSFIMSLPRV
jgi:signal transduction histidine kinase